MENHIHNDEHTVKYIKHGQFNWVVSQVYVAEDHLKKSAHSCRAAQSFGTSGCRLCEAALAPNAAPIRPASGPADAMANSVGVGRTVHVNA